MKSLVLSLFPGIGMLDMAFEEMGFCIVRGPDLLWGGDIQRFHPPTGIFGGVIGGPPCQAFSRLRHMIIRAGHQLAPNLIPEFQRCVAEAAPDWFLMENVQDAPEPEVIGYQIHSQLLRDVWVGGDTTRLRRFCFGTRDGRKLEIEMLALHRPDPEPAVLACGGARSVPVAIGGSGKVKASRRVKAGDIASRLTVAVSLKRSGLPEDFFGKHSPFKIDAQQRMIGNGVPLAMGRAVATAVIKALAAVETGAPR